MGTADPGRDAVPTPSPGLLQALRGELARFPPFSHMAAADVDFFLAHSREQYFAQGEVLQQPADGPVQAIFFIRQGAVVGDEGARGLAGGAAHYEAGDLFPLAAAAAGRGVIGTYSSAGDTFVLALPVARMEELAHRSPAFAAFLQGRIERFLALSRAAVQNAYATQVLAERSLETPLSALAARPALTCEASTPLRAVLQAMEQRGVGSMVVTGAAGEAIGILTRHDVLGRVALAGRSLDTPVQAVMSHPVRTLPASATAAAAALLMARHGVRHVPVVEEARVVGVVSERDLFALQRLSLKQAGAAIRSAADLPALQAAAAQVRGLARTLLSQGVQARQLTALVSDLNDQLTVRLLDLEAAGHGVSLAQACWLALGSEGRQEQTIATDQDNALILPDGMDAPGRAAFLRFAGDVNAALDACGYPLCRGGIMAGQPECCLTLSEWRARFVHWIEHGAPEDLLHASIFFDLRPLAGRTAMAEALGEEVRALAQRTPRFLKQLALNALSHEPPLHWLGGLQAGADGAIDLKLQGTALFVDAARVYALAQGVPEPGTRERLAGAAARLGVPASEAEAWVAGFDFLQQLRLRVQLGEAAAGGGPNRVRLEALHDVDRRILKESLRMAQRLQQRLRLDYDR